MSSITEEEVERRYDLIVSRLGEVVDSDSTLKKILAKRPFRVYWGTAPTGPVHIGYLAPMLKIADFLDAGCEVTILLADIHASLDANETAINLVTIKHRTNVYRTTIMEMLTQLGVDTGRLRVVVGSEFQYSEDYRRDEDIVSSRIGLQDCIRAGAEVVKQSDNPRMSGIRYAYMQCLDEAHLGVDAQFGGIDQRKIFTLSSRVMGILKTERKRLDKKAKLGIYNKKIHLMNRMVPPLAIKRNEDGTKLKMSASSAGTTKLDILDSKKMIQKKVARAFCEPENVDDNTPLTLLTDVLFPLLDRWNTNLHIDRPEEYGGPVEYADKESVRKGFKEGDLAPVDLKAGIVSVLSSFLLPIRDRLLSNPEFRTSFKAGYGIKLQPPPKPKVMIESKPTSKPESEQVVSVV